MTVTTYSHGNLPYGNRTILVDVVLGDGSETASGVVEVFSVIVSVASVLCAVVGVLGLGVLA